MKDSLYPALPILFVDDETIMLNSFRRALNYAGINNLVLTQDSREVMNILECQDVEIILLDLMMPHISGEELLSKISLKYPEIPVIIITGVREVESAVECMRANAYDYLVKPIDEDRLLTSVNRAIKFQEMQSELLSLKQRIFNDGLSSPGSFDKIVTQNKEMIAIFQYIEAIAPSSQPVLITGETGVGKELVSESVHNCSGRNGAFVKISIAGLDDSVFSDTLFGHSRGAFTGAEHPREGLVGKATNGTLFLDEIGDLCEASQLKLLRLIQEREYFQLGSDEIKQTNARIVVATNRNLKALVKSGKFRNDLYYRLFAHHIHLPPLEQRLDDLPLLIDHFLTMAANEYNKEKSKVSEGMLTLLSGYNFPGNIRELKAIIFDAVASQKSNKLNMSIVAEHINKNKNKKDNESATKKISPNNSNIFSHLKQLPTVKRAMHLLILETLDRTNGNKSIAAQILGITRQTVINSLNQNKDVVS